MQLHMQAELADAECIPGRPVQLSTGRQEGHGIVICVGGAHAECPMQSLQAAHTAYLVEQVSHTHLLVAQGQIFHMTMVSSPRCIGSG